MARKENGLAKEEVRFPLHQAPLSAVQELIGAIGAMGAHVRRFDLGEYDVFLFAVRREPDHSGGPHTGARRPTRKLPFELAARLPNPQPPSLESITEAACKRMGVSRTSLESGSRARPVALARFLIAHHASKSDVATIDEVAKSMDRAANSLHVGVARYRKRVPEIFRMSIKQFLDPTEVPSRKLQTLMGKKWSSSSFRSASGSGPATPDAEIGQRLAHALLQEST